MVKGGVDNRSSQNISAEVSANDDNTELEQIDFSASYSPADVGSSSAMSVDAPTRPLRLHRAPH